SFIHYFPQTLTKLDLGYNRMDDQGAKYLAKALQKNKVTRLALFYLPFNHLFTIFHRHLPHFTSITIQSMIREQNILPICYSKTKYDNWHHFASNSIMHSLFFHRHSPYLTSVGMESVIKEQNVLRMRYSKTK